MKQTPNFEVQYERNRLQVATKNRLIRLRAFRETPVNNLWSKSHV
jgi:hypothetical protein